MFKNEISAVIPAQDMTDIKAAFATIASKIPGNFVLPDEVREAMLKINNSNKTFVEDVVKGFNTVKHVMAGYISHSDMQTDLEIFNQADELRMMAKDILDASETIMAISGNEAFIMALAAYNATETPAKRGDQAAKTMREEWGKRFKRPSKKKTDAPQG